MHIKKIIALILIVIIVEQLPAQNIGIGTATPNAKALLDISSTTKGVLFPRMTTSQRLAITTVPAGLMVYDTDKNEYYHYTGSSWRTILNSEYWSRPITTRNRIANTTDSVGIGISSPTEWLDVDGNIRSRNNILADNSIIAAGTVNAGALISTGSIGVASTSVLSGDVYAHANLAVDGTATVDGSVIVNNIGATLQLRNGSNINYGFFQLAGSNLRFGTNSGNTTGSLVIRMNGNDRVVINPAGDINIEGKITKSAVSGFSNLLPLAYGNVNADGTIRSGSGNFTVQKLATGNYRINCTGVTTNSVILATSRAATVIVSVNSLTADDFEIDTFDAWYYEDFYDSGFTFLVYAGN